MTYKNIGLNFKIIRRQNHLQTITINIKLVSQLKNNGGQ